MAVPGISRDMPLIRAKTALLLVDMQRIWLEPGADPAHPHASPDEYFYRHTRETVIPNQLLLLAAARRAKVEVLHTIIQSLTMDGRDRSLDYKLSAMHVPPNLAEARPVPALAPRGDEILLPKTSSGVFNSTTLDYLLRNLGIRQLIVMGIFTDQCVDMAVRDGADRGYLITCVKDACAAKTQEGHEAALRAFAGYCRIVDTVSVLTELAAL